MFRPSSLIRPAILGAVLILAACKPDPEPTVLRLSGETMGTTYTIVAIADEEIEAAPLQAAVEQTLATVNSKMSNWDPNSEVSLFSKSNSTGATSVSPAFAKVIAAANQVHEQSEGRFDVTLGPLIELWGFGPRKPESPVPADADIQAALAQVGQGTLLSLDAGALTLTKTAPGVGINLSAIAKGYGVDEVAATLAGHSVDSYMVEIGGDLVTKGQNPEGKPWQIGVERPDAAGKTVELIVPVSDLGMATSGDYRNYFEQDGVRYSHIIDATTGRPITHRTASVTVLADSAMMADAWATAMLALGEERGLQIAEEIGLAVYFISRSTTPDQGEFDSAGSKAFDALMAAK